MEITVKHIITVDSTVLGLLSLLLENAKDINTKTAKIEAVLVNKEPEKKIVPKEVEITETTSADKPKHTREEVRTKAIELKSKKGTMKIKEILTKFNAASVSSLGDELIDDVMKAIEEELNA